MSTPSRKFVPKIPSPISSPSVALSSSKMSDGLAGDPLHSALLIRVKRRREEEPLDALLVAEPPSKRQSILTEMGALSLSSHAADSKEAQGASNGEERPAESPMLFRLVQSVSNSSTCEPHVRDNTVNESLDSSALNAEKVREIIRRMSDKKSTPRAGILRKREDWQRSDGMSADDSLERRKGKHLHGTKVARSCMVDASRQSVFDVQEDSMPRVRIVDVAVEADKDGLLSAKKKKPEIFDDANASVDFDHGFHSFRSDGELACNGEVIEREVFSPAQRPRTEEGEDSEFVYDYYWMDPASASNFSPLSRIGRINLDVSELWDDDLLDCGGEDPTFLYESEDSNAEDNPRNDYPDEEESDFDEENLSDDDFDRSSLGGLYEKRLRRDMVNDLSDDDLDLYDDQEAFKASSSRFAYDMSEDSDE
ncbi:hypothetical protein GUITHDRAFT_107965 [Guillardia theta CCMP2712]|uniref:Probable RNA polymerase II nuclear localization protein SLC7A6OS n=1 Tax=Guillardia theta (strain CCMP2712) TaxID=905079 RepID=L1JCV3_GUITC|nr:hypothetical protein GUITHDRAFT_107965 [Guillardia theta CCMP2712]EKX46358.1 hypothetical protein GUITHDRAFT_107965 [Guillardia theta CCMP2712]|mmetsp:Transcript_40674/g.128242  ORF Transcript_40674/g.128242 Transcript_40674/m.128242 type:complete len:423 (-) Transcript_40674:50-1318(-)|eukprot:XP_005833338.1 hypothetical protein GUITHDRAFT_107965 [Guillardia theta CCMP2712]